MQSHQSKGRKVEMCQSKSAFDFQIRKADRATLRSIFPFPLPVFLFAILKNVVSLKGGIIRRTSCKIDKRSVKNLSSVAKHCEPRDRRGTWKSKLTDRAVSVQRWRWGSALGNVCIARGRGLLPRDAVVL